VSRFASGLQRGALRRPDRQASPRRVNSSGHGFTESGQGSGESPICPDRTTNRSRHGLSSYYCRPVNCRSGCSDRPPGLLRGNENRLSCRLRPPGTDVTHRRKKHAGGKTKKIVIGLRWNGGGGGPPRREFFRFFTTGGTLPPTKRTRFRRWPGTLWFTILARPGFGGGRR